MRRRTGTASGPASSSVTVTRAPAAGSSVSDMAAKPARSICARSRGGEEKGEQPAPGWTETDSQRFIDDGAVFVPSRDEQIATLCALIPARADEAFTVAELGAGAGVLARAVLEAFPRCRYVALDGSAAMRTRLTET